MSRPLVPAASAECEDYDDRLQWISHASTPTGVVNVTVAEGHMYVPGAAQGVVVFDVSDPRNPVEVGAVDTGGTATDVAFKGDYAYVADLFQGVQVLDVRNPHAPFWVGNIATAMPAVSVFLAKGYLFIGEANFPFFSPSVLEVASIDPPQSPEIVATMATPSWARDIAIAGDQLYVAVEEKGMIRVDITDPENPVTTAALVLPGVCEGLAVDATGEHAYLACGQAGGLQSVRISESSPLEVLGSVAIPSVAEAVALYGNYACVAALYDGLQVVDVSNPASPTLIGSLDTPVEAWGVTTHGSNAYVCDNYSVEIYELGEEPRNVESIPIVEDIDATDIALDGSTAIVVGQSSGMNVYDVADPLHPVVIGSCGIPGSCVGLDLQGDYAYTSSWSGEVAVVDVRDPHAPFVVGVDSLETSACDIDVVGSYAFLAARRFAVFDVSNPADPELVANIPTSAESRARKGIVSGDYAYVADEAAGLVVIDVSSPRNPVVVRTVGVDGGAYAVGVSGDHAYLSGNDKRFYVIDVSVPEMAAIVGSVPLESRANRIWADGQVAYVACSYPWGVYAVDVQEPTRPYLLGQLIIPSVGLGIEVTDDWVYVAGSPFVVAGPPHCSDAGSSVDVSEEIDGGASGRLLSVWPTPASGPVTLAFDWRAGGTADALVGIFDASGRCVRRLAAAVGGPAGGRQVSWDGLDEQGRPAPSGTYFARLDGGVAAGRRAATRILLLR
ncbi:MAG: FlgD immunoglobulin-like domain containing protein [Candidatus Eisenbacteria bacterium]